MTAEGTFPKINGDILYTSEANSFGVVQSLYTGTGFNVTTGGTSGAQTTLAFVPPTTAKYARVRSNVKIALGGEPTRSTQADLTAQIAGSATSLSFTGMNGSYSFANGCGNNDAQE